jgi:hypothetical protein
MLSLAIAAAANQLAAVAVRRMPAPEANQGVAADARSVYAIDNSAIARYDKASGRRLAQWRGDPKRFKHLNSCIARMRELICAASNYPEVPMTSMVLWFDARTLRLRRSRPLKAGFGSLTWLDWHQGSWWAGYAHYDGKGGELGRTHRDTVVVRYSARFQPIASYRFPATVLARFSPRSSSGGAWGQDGLLYVTGHDRPELYAMRVPDRGTMLEHVATIATPTGGQAINWDPRQARILWSIERKSSELVASNVPVVIGRN